MTAMEKELEWWTNALRLLGLTIKNIKFTKDDFAEFFDETLPSVSQSAIS